MLTQLKAWLLRNPPDTMPFWKGAKTTTSFGLRNSQLIIKSGCNPGHLGVDRADGDETYLTMPFSGRVTWDEVGGVAGSLTRIIADGLSLEIQVFHALCPGPLKDHYETGERLPIKPYNLGKSFGIHAHTELIMPYDNKLVDWMRGQSITIGDEYILAHAAKYDMDPYILIKGLARQVKAWGITEFYSHYAVRLGVPEYRRPHWGDGWTVHIDSNWLLKI